MSSMLRQPCDEGVIRTGSTPADQKAVSSSVGTWVLAATILGSSMVFIDGTVVNVALPSLQTAFHATASDVQWIVEGYSLFLAALILVGGALGDLYGRRLVFGVGVALFALASIGCGLSLSVHRLIFARAVQGIGGALLTPGSLAILSATFPADQRGRAIGTWSGFTSITTAAGPLLGGWMVQHVGWRWIFFINVPLALVVLALVFFRVPESRDEQTERRLDWVGATLVTLSLCGLVFGLIEVSVLGLRHPLVLGALAFGIVGLGAFLHVEAHSKMPMMPLTLFRSSTFLGANLLTFLLYAGLSVVLYYLPFDLIQVQGYTPTAAGAALLPLILILFFFSRWAGGLVDRYGAKRPLVIGPLIASTGFALLALPASRGSYWTTFFPAILVLGIGMAISVAPLTTVVMGAVPTRNAGVASGINNAISRAAGLLAIACIGVVVFFVFNRELDRRLATMHASPQIHHALETQRVKLAAADLPPGFSTEERTVVKRSIALSFIQSFRVTVGIAALLALLSAAVAARMIGPNATKVES